MSCSEDGPEGGHSFASGQLDAAAINGLEERELLLYSLIASAQPMNLDSALSGWGRFFFFPKPMLEIGMAPAPGTARCKKKKEIRTGVSLGQGVTWTR